MEEVVEAVHVAVEGVPRGTFLPTRAAALHWLVGELRLSYAEAQALLPSGRNAKTTSLRRAMTA
ncbi:MAG: hypothetical protein Q8S13_05630, partial [Dehalococcoidia bacterium]|nr:hypothetical protein [Dehalococcoidia bacterium]